MGRPLSSRVALWLGHLLILAFAVAGFVFAFGSLTQSSATRWSARLPQLFPFATMSVSVDGLSAYFLLVVTLVTAAAAIYGPSYLGAHPKAPMVQTAAL